MISKIIGNIEKKIAVDTNDISKAISGLSNDNLLDNPFFIVNQRGASQYKENVYTVDRWINYVGTTAITNAVEVTSNGVTINTGGNTVVTFNQFLNEKASNFTNKLLTFSVIINDELKAVTGFLTEYLSSITITNNISVKITNDNRLQLIFTGTNNTFPIRSVKLEPGSVSTLANDVVPDYTLELAKCQTSTADPNDTYANQGQLMTSALQGELGAKNLVNTSSVELDYMTQNGETFTSNSSDSRNIFDFRINAFTNSSFISMLAAKAIDSTGIYEFPITIPSGTTRIAFTHNGGSKNLGIKVFFSKTGNFIASLKITGYDPTTVGGISFCDIMIRDARITDSTWVPYAMTNKELTDSQRKYTLSGNKTYQITSDHAYDVLFLIGQRGGESIADIVPMHPWATITHLTSTNGITMTAIDEKSVQVSLPQYYGVVIQTHFGNLTVTEV